MQRNFKHLRISQNRVGLLETGADGTPPPSPLAIVMSAAYESHIKTVGVEPFLRVLHAFQPSRNISPSSICLHVNVGDIIQAHSLHTSGWVDGTAMSTDERGWVPGNYLQIYDAKEVRPLLHAVLALSHHVRNEIHGHQSIVAAIVAGVRHVLEMANCISRDSEIIQANAAVRKERKGLLSELNALVSSAKGISFSTGNTGVTDANGEMLYRSERIVAKAARLIDTLQHPSPDSIPPTPPYHESESRRRSRSTASLQSSSTELALAPLSCQTRLTAALDLLLSFLASYIGRVHLQSRSPSQLLLTTRQSVHAAKELLEIIEVIGARSGQAAVLDGPKNGLYRKITYLVSAARDVVAAHPDDDSDLGVVIPSEGRKLVEAATACVRAAGDCVAKARDIVDRYGDFNILDATSARNSTSSSLSSPCGQAYSADQSEDGDDSRSHLIYERDDTITATAEVSEDNNELDQTTPRPPFSSPKLRHTSSSNVLRDVRDTDIPQLEQDTSLSYIPLSGTGSNKNSLLPRLPAVSLSSASSEFSAKQPRAQSRPSAPTKDEKSDKSSPGASVGSGSLSAPSQQDSPHLSNRTSTTSQSTYTFEVEDVSANRPACELICNIEGNVTGGTLRALVERLTVHDTTPDPTFATTFFLTFHLFTSSEKFAAALVERYNSASFNTPASIPIRLRVFNVFKSWLENHWRPECDTPSLPIIVSFAEGALRETLPQASSRLLALSKKISTEWTVSVRGSSDSGSQTGVRFAEGHFSESTYPSILLTKNQASMLQSGKNLTILEFDPLEIARQFTIKESKLFCAIQPQELLGQEFSKPLGTSMAVNVKAMSTLSTEFTNFVTETILAPDDAKKRTAVLKQWIKVAERCLELCNYNSLLAILAAFSSSTVTRLKKTWDGLSQKYRTSYANMMELTDPQRNYAAYRAKLRNHVHPCLPFLGLYRTDGNPAFRTLYTEDGQAVQLINFDKHMKSAKIISEIQRFQVAYTLTEIPELQSWIENKLAGVRMTEASDVSAQYRRSLRLEPRQMKPRSDSSTPIPGESGSLIRPFMPTRNRSDSFFSWSNKSKSLLNPEAINFLT